MRDSLDGAACTPNLQQPFYQQIRSCGTCKRNTRLPKKKRASAILTQHANSATKVCAIAQAALMHGCWITSRLPLHVALGLAGLEPKPRAVNQPLAWRFLVSESMSPKDERFVLSFGCIESTPNLPNQRDRQSLSSSMKPPCSRLCASVCLESVQSDAVRVFMT